jgi:hypothetical protein
MAQPKLYRLTSSIDYSSEIQSFKQVQILCFWASIVLSLSKNNVLFFSKHNVSELDSVSVFR